MNEHLISVRVTYGKQDDFSSHVYALFARIRLKPRGHGAGIYI